MTLLGIPAGQGQSVLGPAFTAPVAAQPVPVAQPALPDGPGVPGAAPQLPQDSVSEDDGSVWVSHGGKLYTVASGELQQAAASMPGLRLATPDEVRETKDIEVQSADPGAGMKAGLEQFGVGLANAVSSAGRGLAAAGSVAAGYLGATETERDLQQFARESTGESLARDIAYLTGGLENENAFVRNYRAREKAYPLTAGVARTAGLLVPAIATAGAAAATSGAAAGAGAASRLASALLSPSGAAAAGIGGAVQGLAGGLAQPFETMRDTPISREAILASGGMGAVLGGALGFGIGAAVQAAPSALARVFGKKTAAVADEEVRAALPDAVKQMAESPVAEQRTLYESILKRGGEVGKEANAIADRLELAAAKAGPNPELRAAAVNEAVEAEVQRLSRTKAGEILPSEWRSREWTPDEMVRNRDVLKLGARNEITERLTDVLDGSKQALEHLRNFELKRPLVAKNLADMPEELQSQAIGKALSFVRQRRAEFEKIFEGGENALRPSKASESLGFTFNEAEEALAKAPSAADAYLAVDKLRRATDKWLGPLTNQARATDAIAAREGTELLKFAEGTYENARLFLGDADTWGKQGMLQQAVNSAWADDIAAEGRVTKLGAFLSRDVSDRYGQFAQRVDPDKIDRYLDGLGRKTLPDTDLNRMLETKARLMGEVAKAYDIPAGTVSRAIDATKELAAAVKQANAVMTASGGFETQLTQVLQSRLAKMAGSAAGAGIGGIFGGAPGALIGHSVGAAIEEYATARLPAVVQALTKNKLGIGRLPQAYKRALNRNMVESIPAATRLELFERKSDRGAQLEQFDRRTAALSRLATPEALAAAAAPALARFGAVQQTLPASTQLAAQERIQRLAAAWPAAPKGLAVRGKAQTTASEQTLRLQQAMWEATFEPLKTVEAFEKGVVDPDQAKFTWVQYPELQRLFQAATLDTLKSIPENTPIEHNTLAQLDQFFGFGGVLDESAAPAQLATAAMLAAQRAVTSEESAPRPVNVQNYQTRVNQMSGMGAKNV